MKTEIRGALRFLAGGAAFALIASTSSASVGTFQEVGGIVVAEFEAHAPTGSWTSKTQYGGFTGSKYYEWTGPDYFSQPGNGVMSYQFEIFQAGQYQLRIHNRHNDPDSSESNDVWVKLDNGGWKKVYSNQGPSTVNQWNWHTRFDNGSAPHTDVFYNLSAGVHTIEYSGRSNGFMIDRFHLHLPNHPDATNTNAPQSPTDAVSVYCQSKTNSQGCVPSIDWLGTPNIGDGSSMTLIANQVINQKPGSLLYGFSPDSLPAGGGVLCVGPPVRRLGPLWSTGSSSGVDCSGSLRYDFEAWVATGNDPALVSGQTVYAQFWSRDPWSAQPISLTQGLQFQLQ